MIQKLFHHALDVVCENGRYRPRRFTEKQTEALAALNPWFGQTSRTASGVSLQCYTAAETVSFAYALAYTTQRVSGFDVYENGLLVHHEPLPLEDTAAAQFVYRKETVEEVLLEIVLPSAAEVQLWDLDFGAWRPYDPAGKPLVLWYGDSLTQSTSVANPSLTFAALSSRLADVDYVNRGIGSLYYDRSVLDEADPLQPDIVMVEFGSNDLVKHGADKQVVYVDGDTAADVPALMDNARAYLQKLRLIYPDARIFVVSLLWTAEELPDAAIQANAAYDLALERLAEELSLGFIPGLTLMPHLPLCCVEDRVHLSLAGSLATAQSLVKYLRSAKT